MTTPQRVATRYGVSRVGQQLAELNASLKPVKEYTYYPGTDRPHSVRTGGTAGSALGGIAVGGATGFGVRRAITGEINLPTGLGNFLGRGKGIDFSRPGQTIGQALHAAFGKGPDLAGAMGAVGIGGAGPATVAQRGCN